MLQEIKVKFFVTSSNKNGNGIQIVKARPLTYYFLPERHISIQRQLADLEKLVFITEGDFDSASSLNSDNLETGISMFGQVFFSEFLMVCHFSTDAQFA